MERLVTIIIRKLIGITMAVMILTVAGVNCMASYDADTDYMWEMISAAVVGDVEKGKKAELLRAEKIEGLSLDDDDVSFEDLYLVAKVIQAEAGSNWLSDEHQLLVGNVLLNRVDSSEFPDTVADCVYQKGQYYSKGNTYFQRLVPSQRAVENAARLLQGERVCPSSVVFQANFRQGSGVYKLISDRYLGNSYFCHSSKMSLYNDEQAA